MKNRGFKPQVKTNEDGILERDGTCSYKGCDHPWTKTRVTGEGTVIGYCFPHFRQAMWLFWWQKRRAA